PTSPPHLPTRRSSDLRTEYRVHHSRQKADEQGSLGDFSGCPREMGPNGPGQDQGSDDDDSDGVAQPPSPPVPQQLGRTQRVHEGDRKSTRLNSSHGSI